MSSNLVKAVPIALFALGLTVTGAFQANADGSKSRTHKVKCPKQSLQRAVDRAKEGDTIKVSGTCEEQITIRTDRLTLDGQGSAVIDGSSLTSGNLVRVQALLVTIRNLTVRNSPRVGIHVRRSGSALIEGNTIEMNANDGVRVVQSAYARIGAGSGEHPAAGAAPGNLIQNNGRDGIFVGIGGSAHVFHNKITGNTRDGIRVTTSAAARIDGNEITGNDRGVHFRINAAARLSDHPNHYGTNPTFAGPENNLIQGNSVGLRCRLGGAADGNLQNFGTGNTTNTDFSGNCPVNPDIYVP